MSSNLAHCVVDASVAIKLFIKQDGSEQAAELFAQLSTLPQTRLYVPELFYAECANVLWQYVRRANYLAAAAKTSLTRLQALALQTVAISDVIDEAFGIAIAHSISAYDACYIELSNQLKIPLVTADAKLVRALTGTIYQAFSLAEFLALDSD